MADENKGPEQSPDGTPTIPETPAPAAPPKGQGSWTPEQQAENTRKLQAHANLVKKAEAQGYDSPEQYLADLETSNTELKTTVEELNFNEPIVDTPAATETEVEQPQYDDKRMKALELTNFNVILRVDWNEYHNNPENKERNYDKAKLNDFMNSNKGLVTQIATDESIGGGTPNYYQIASDQMAFRDYQKNKGAPAPNEAVDTTKAEQTAIVEQSTGDPAPNKKSDNDKRADEIAEDTVYRYPGD